MQCAKLCFRHKFICLPLLFVMSAELKLFVFLIVGLLAAECSIVKFPSKKDRLFQAEQELFPIEEIHSDLAAVTGQRVKRAAGEPVYNKSDLHDTNNFGIVSYSGGNSTVSVILQILNYIQCCHTMLYTFSQLLLSYIVLPCSHILLNLFSGQKWNSTIIMTNIIVIIPTQVIFVLTYQVSNGAVTTWNLYISINYGISFEKINSRIGTGITLVNNIFISPEDPKRV